MITDPSLVVLTARLAYWVDEHPARVAWIIECLARHNASDWGDLDSDDASLNDASLVRRHGQVLSRYAVPPALLDEDPDDDSIWIITDDLADTEGTTTLLWPMDY
ncbi:MAG: hypothetical protein AAB131_11835 [Actinomycetota bacterium]